MVADGPYLPTPIQLLKSKIAVITTQIIHEAAEEEPITHKEYRHRRQMVEESVDSLVNELYSELQRRIKEELIMAGVSFPQMDGCQCATNSRNIKQIDRFLARVMGPM